MSVIHSHVGRSVPAGRRLSSPTPISMDLHGSRLLTVFGTGDIEQTLVSFIASWLAGEFGHGFVPEAGGEYGLAYQAFADKLLDLDRHRKFVIAAASSELAEQERPIAPWLSEFANGGSLVRWLTRGIIRAYESATTGNATILIDSIPGALVFGALSKSRRREDVSRTARAWFGIGEPIADPDDILQSLEATQRHMAHN